MDLQQVVKEGEDLNDPAKKKAVKKEVRSLFENKYKEPDRKSEKWAHVQFFFKRLRF